MNIRFSQVAFENYLEYELKVSRKTIRNYRSDLNHFLAWSTFKLQTLGKRINNTEDVLPHLSFSLLESYKHFLLTNKVPSSTVNRRLSALRNFCKYLSFKGHLKDNPALGVANIEEVKPFEEQVESLLSAFEEELKERKASKATTKNYVSDVRQFLIWVNSELNPT